MFAKLRPRSAYDVMAALALFLVVTGGTAFAVVASNQVNSASIIDGEVKNPDLATDAVGPLKVKDNSLTGADVAESSLGTVPNADALEGLHASSLQRRINAPCPPGTGIRLVTQGGAPECVRGPEARESYKRDSVDLCESGCPVATLALPVGAWAISSKVTLQSAGPHQNVTCTLANVSTVSNRVFDDAQSYGDNSSVGISLQGLTRVQHNGDKITLICADPYKHGSYTLGRRITAIRIDNKAVYSNGQPLP